MEISTKYDSEIVIEPLIDNKTHGLAVQEKKFKYSLRFTNKGVPPSGAFTINKIEIGSAQGQNMRVVEEKSFLIQSLNPSEEKIIPIGNYGVHMYGLANVSVQINPSQPEKQIACYQKNYFTNEIAYVKTNNWYDFIYIKTRGEYQQETSNSRMLWLTVAIFIMTALQVIYVLKEPFKKYWWSDNLNMGIKAQQESTNKIPNYK